jgi:predicted  nucleic acid-binding Zn-ribbon protein
MNVERTIEFLLKNQASMDARFDARFERADKRLERLEKVVGQNNRLVSQLVRRGVSLRSDVRKTQEELRTFRLRTEENFTKISESLSETDDKLNALVLLMDRHLRGNGKQK